ncbi:hypothetical protein ABHN11_30505 [Brevibacillus centrosporus]|uniref:hypothetical protein n=1 Tax=Brevibacillus centrosporus TaxID=54910 RepID=UPI0039859A05
MLTGEQFARYLLEKEGFSHYLVKQGRLNSQFRYSKGKVPTIFLLKQHQDHKEESLLVAAHEVGHALDLIDKGRYDSVRYYFYGYILSNLITFFTPIFFLPVLIFGIASCMAYIKTESAADAHKRNLVKKYLRDAYHQYDDSRSPDEVVQLAENRLKTDRKQTYRIAILYFIVFPLIVHTSAFSFWVDLVI